MEPDGGIDEIIQTVPLPDRGRLKEFMALKPGSPAVHDARRDEARGFRHRQHVLFQHGAHRAVPGFVALGTETGVEVCPVSLGQHAGIKLGLVPGFFAQAGTVRIMNVAVEIIRPFRFVADGHGDDAPGAEYIVQVIAPVRPHRNVRGIKVPLKIPVCRILILPVNHAFIFPVSQIIRRRGPADIIPHAVHIAAEKIVGAVDINPVAENIGFSVRHILPVGKIGIDHLLFFHALVLLFPVCESKSFL